MNTYRCLLIWDCDLKCVSMWNVIDGQNKQLKGLGSGDASAYKNIRVIQ